jgi:hypothetical protein
MGNKNPMNSRVIGLMNRSIAPVPAKFLLVSKFTFLVPPTVSVLRAYA